jgi:hypothetical protein
MGWDEQQAWITERGLRAREAYWCPRLLVPKQRCIRYSLGEKVRAKGKRCICEDPAIEALKDHSRVLHSARTRHVLTTDPYNATEERIEALRESVKTIGAIVRVHDGNVWADGVPTLIITAWDVTSEMLRL